MAKKQKQVDRRAFKKEGEELQQWLIFRKRGSKVESGKKYNRQKFKRGDKEWKQHNKLPKSGKHRWMTIASNAPTAGVPPKWNGYTRTATPTGSRRKMCMSVGAVSGLKSSSTWLATTYWKTRGKTFVFSFQFEPLAWGPGERNLSFYTICTIFKPKTCATLLLALSHNLWYTIIVKGDSLQWPWAFVFGSGQHPRYHWDWKRNSSKQGKSRYSRGWK